VTCLSASPTELCKQRLVATVDRRTQIAQTDARGRSLALEPVTFCYKEDS